MRLAGRVHESEARLARAHTGKRLKFTLPGPMTIVDTVADRYYGSGKEGRIKMAFAFAELLNQEARALAADGVDIVQFDEPAFNVYMADAAEWGVAALERAAEGLTCKTAVHICYGYGIKANVDWKQTLGDEWRQYEQIFPALAKSRIDQVSLECYHSHVPAELMRLLDGKDVMVGVIDVASDVIETPEEVAATIESALRYVPAERLFPCTNCGLAPMRREVAEAKLAALGKGAALARQRRGRMSAARTERADDSRSTASPPRSPDARPRRPRAGRLRALRRHARRRARRAAIVVGRAAARRAPARRRPLPAPPPRELRRRRRRDSASCRSARTGSRSNTTPCTAASSAGSSRSRPASSPRRRGAASSWRSPRSRRG